MPSSRPKPHNKSPSGKLKIVKQPLSKGNKITESTMSSTVSEEPKQSDLESQFVLELYWCIQQLENSLKSGKLNQKQALDTEKSLKLLKSPNQPTVRKRQIMHMSFGNYKLKMAEEEKKMSLDSKKIQFTNSNIDKKNDKKIKSSCFLKKSTLLVNHRNDNNDKVDLPPVHGIEQLKITDNNSAESEIESAHQKDNKVESESESDNKIQIEENNASHKIDSKNIFKFNFDIET